MKKTDYIHSIIMVIASSATFLMSMDYDSNTVLFPGDFSIVQVKKSHLPLIKTLDAAYKEHKSLADMGRIVPLYDVYSTGIKLVNDALNVRPDEFTAHYYQLTKEQQICLINAAGKYSSIISKRNMTDAAGKRISVSKKKMLDAPEVTKRLIDVYFPKDVADHIKSYFIEEDKSFILSHFKEQLIRTKQLLGLKQPCLMASSASLIPADVYLGSLFIDRGSTINQYDYPILLYTGNKVCKTYATNFGINDYEYRITDVEDKECLVWWINHADPRDTVSTRITLKTPIKGCRLSNGIVRATHGDRDVEYAVIYSEDDMVVFTMTVDKGKLSVNSQAITIGEGCTIVDVCFDPVSNNWAVGLYDKLNLRSVWKFTKKDGTCYSGMEFPFKDYGLLGKIAIYKKNFDFYCAVMMEVANLYSIQLYKSEDDGYYHYDSNSTKLKSAESHNDSFDFKMLAVGNKMHLFWYQSNFFTNGDVKEQKKSSTKEQKDQPVAWSFEGIFNSIVSTLNQTDNAIHRVYSPDGSFLMCNALKKKLGVTYLETVLKDAVTHKEILSIDTLYTNVYGVGFSGDGTALSFFTHMGPIDKITLLNNDDKEILHTIEDLVFTNGGITALVKRLCMECKEKGFIRLQKNDSTYSMLIDWSRRSPAMLTFLQKCLPMGTI